MFGKSLVLASPLTESVVGTSGVSLRGGRIQVRANGGESFAVTAPFFKVNIVSSGSAPGLAKMGSAEIRLSGQHAQVSAVTGSAELLAAGNIAPLKLHPGETANLDAAGADAASGQGAASPATGPAAGQLSRVLPQVQIDRASQQLVAAVYAPIYWNDDLHSGSKGRARIALQDGSLLNLGSNSELRVLQHDAQAQQTSLDLAVGRMRGQIMKLTRPGAKFEIKTPVGVAGLVGTDFSLLVTPNFTELMVFEGAVRFTVASTGQAITVPAGMKLRISRTGATEGPSPATPGEIQTAKNLTDVSEGPPQTAGGKGASPLIPIVLSVTAGAVVLAISIPLDLHQPVSPMTVSTTTTPTKPVVD
jgi:ferric-dicitrate binding protein FerR (iron transport regulator)